MVGRPRAFLDAGQNRLFKRRETSHANPYGAAAGIDGSGQANPASGPGAGPRPDYELKSGGATFDF